MILISIYLIYLKSEVLQKKKKKNKREKLIISNFISFFYKLSHIHLKYNFEKFESKVKLKQFKTTKQIYPGYKSKQLYLVNIYITKHE